MRIAGFVKTTSLDWEGRYSCKILMPGCNLDCPYCNQRLDDVTEYIDEDSIFDYIDGKSDFLTGIVISGGEPTSSPDLYALLKELRKRRIPIRLDTNGMAPEILDDLIGAKMVDCVCMNLMAPFDNETYSSMTGKQIDVSTIKKSISVIRDSKIDNIFRTVAIPGIITEDSIANIAKEIGFAKQYVIIQFDPKKTNDRKMSNIVPYSKTEMTVIAKSAKKYVKNVCIREI
jgi:pyruvate formate lyase activating enzyme